MGQVAEHHGGAGLSTAWESTTADSISPEIWELTIIEKTSAITLILLAFHAPKMKVDQNAVVMIDMGH